MNDDDPAALHRMLQYLYTADYDDADIDTKIATSAISTANGSKHQISCSAILGLPLMDSQSKTTNGSEDDDVSTSPIMNNILVYALADKYNISTLKDIGVEKFSARCSSTGKWDEETLFSAIGTIYNTTPDGDRGLRDPISAICLQRIEDSSGDVLKDTRFREILETNGAFAFDVLSRVHEAKKMEILSLKQQVKQLGNAEKAMRELVHNTQNQLSTSRNMADATRERLQEDGKILVRALAKRASCTACKGAVEVTVPTHMFVGMRGVLYKCTKCGMVLRE